MIMMSRSSTTGGSAPARSPLLATAAILVSLGLFGSQARAQDAPQDSDAKPGADGDAGTDAGGEDEAGLPEGVLARVNGRDVTVEEYAAYLLASIGKSKLDEYVDRLLIQAEAEELDIEITPQRVEELLSERIERTIEALHQGDRELFIASLEKRSTSLEDYQAQLRQEIYYDALREGIILSRRTVTDEDVRREFERVYGEDGTQLVLRHVLVATRAGPIDGEGRSETEAKERAETILKEIQGGLRFEEAVAKYSDDNYRKRNGGLIPHYREGLFGKDFHEAVSALTMENPVSGVIASPRGYHIAKLVERRTTRFEDVAKELREALEKRPPTPRERHELITALRAKATIEES